MKKLIFVFIVILVCFGLFAKTEVPIQEKSPIHTSVNATDDLWDVLLQFDVDTPTGQTGLAGMEWDGTYFYATKWSGSSELFQFDATGTYIAPITVPVTGCRDVAHDGTYFYGSAATASVTCWEPQTGAAVAANNVNVAGASVRAIAYDEVTDTFWSGNWSDNVVNWDRTGTILNSYPWAGSMYGMAYDNDPQGPYLYAHSQDTGCVVYRLDPNDNLAQLEIMDYTGIGGTSAIAGGACTMTDWDPAYRTLGLLLQGSPDYIVVVELAIGSDPDAPGAPTDVAVIPDAGGALEALVTWVCPSVTVGGATLTDLDEMRVYRDGVLIYTDSTPSIGSTGTYTDAGLTASGTYGYIVVGSNDQGEGIPVSYSTWVGEDVPNVVTDLLLEQTSAGALSGTLTWVNPTTGMNGGAFNNAVVGYHIERNDGEMFELAGSATTYVDDTIPLAGQYCYTVTPYNVVGDGGSATSNLVLIADAGLLILEDFSGGVPPAGWYIDGMGQTNWVSSATANAGGEAPEAMLSWSPSFVGMTRLCTMTLDTSGMTGMAVEFKHNVNDYAGGYTLGCATSSDGTTWNDAWSIVPAGPIGPGTINVDITTPDVGSATFQMCFYLDGDSFDINYWYIDDVMLTGDGGGGPTLDPPTNLAVESNTNEDFATFSWDSPAGGGGDIEELIYDNGTSTGAYSYTGFSMGTQMSPASGCQILELKVHTSDGTEFNAEVWGWDAGAPTEDLLHTELANAVLDDWVIVDVSDENLMVTGDFVVAFGSIDATTYMSYDAGLNNGRAWDHDDTGGWASWTEAYLVRAVVQYGDGTIAELSPTPAKTVGTHSSIRGEKVSIDVIDHNVDSSRELQSFNVYLDGVMAGNTTDTEWIFTGLTNGDTYTAGVEAVYDEGLSALIEIDFEYMGLGAGNNIVGNTVLNANYPNPFNPETNIAFSVHETGNVTLEVYNTRGQLVKTLVNNVTEAGDHYVTWNGTNDAGKTVASGVYFYKMKTANFDSTKKMILMK
jgi:flagellar hook capping protein FlgD